MIDNIKLHIIDITIIVAYLVACLVIGLRKFDQIKTLRDYTLGVRPFSTSVLMATIVATSIGANSTIGYTQKSYSLGLVFILPILIEPVRYFIMSKLFSDNLTLFKQRQFISLSDMMEHWYGSTGKWISNFCAIFISLGVAAAGITAMGYLLHYFLGISQMYGAILAVAVITTYSILGGVQAVVLTDLFQFLVFFFGIPMACAIGLSHTGGIKNVLNSIPAEHLAINSSNMALFLTLIFYNIIPPIDIARTQRILLARDSKQLTKAFNTAGTVSIVYFSSVALLGLIIYSLNPNIDSNIAIYHFIDHYLSTGTTGFMIAGLLAVIMSTIDSFLNSTSSLIARDVCKEIWPTLTDKAQLTIARISCFVMVMIGLGIAFLKPNIVETIWLTDNFWIPLIVIPMSAALLGAKISHKSFTALVISCVTVLVAARLYFGEFDTKSNAIAALVSALILYVANRRYKNQHREMGVDKNVSDLAEYDVELKHPEKNKEKAKIYEEVEG